MTGSVTSRANYFLEPRIPLFQKLKRLFLSGSSDTSSTKVDSTEKAVPALKAEPWGGFFDTELLQRWSIELRQAIVDRGAEEWRLTGTALILQTSDEADFARLLLRVAEDAQMKFIRVPAIQVLDIHLDIRERYRHLAPVLVMLDHGGWLSGNPENNESDDGPKSNAFTAALGQALGKFDPTAPVVLAVCAESMDNVSPDLMKIGRFDRAFKIEPPDALFLGQAFLQKLGGDLVDDAMKSVPAKVGLMLLGEFETPDSRDLAALRLQRLARKESRRLVFNDLANLVIRGGQEVGQKALKGSTDATRKKTALHEAGHACIAVIASNGDNVPDYASIVPARGFEGIVLESLAYYEDQDEFTFQSLLLKVRIWLAGRAAEELFFGPVNVSSGANSDLAAATRMCFRMFAYSGFHPGMDSMEVSATNLAVLNWGEVDPMQNDRVRRDVRQFLEQQYHHVLKTLQENKPFVEAVADRLQWDPVVDQAEMTEIARNFGYPMGKKSLP